MLDPATGDGELLISLLAQFDGLGTGAIEVHGFETDIRAVNIARDRIKQRFPKVALHLAYGSFLDFVLDEVLSLIHI